MKSLWDDQEANEYQGDLAQRVYTSRLLGRDPTLVLHGGGNTSVKVTEKNIFGEAKEILYVKGSGWDLVSIEADGFAPVEQKYVARLAELPELSDPQMVNELKTHMKNASAPTPSVEAILHAILPYKYVDHTHANAVLTITNSVGGADKIKQIYGDTVVIVPYVMPGFVLSGACKRAYDEQVNDNTIGMILLNHGVFSFGVTAKESYERMIQLVDKAEQYLKDSNAWDLPQKQIINPEFDRNSISKLRKRLSQVAGRPMICAVHNNDRVMQFVQRDDLEQVSQQGPLTPDHVIRTKRLPMLGDSLESYIKEYKQYFEQNHQQGQVMLDPAPRIMLDKRLGMMTIGNNAKSAGIVEDIYRYSMDVIERAELNGGYRALPASDIFEVEYWDLEQAKLKSGGKSPVFEGEVVLITGAASGIGRACAEHFLSLGAAVIGLDINSAIMTQFENNKAYKGIVCDVSDTPGIRLALDEGVRAFGGLDMLVLNAGMFPGGRKIAELDDGQWRAVMQINLDANLTFLRESYPLLQQAPNGGRVAIVGSKNVPAPGPGAAAYSASKAALNQLARIAALEWGSDNIRINSVHPDAVFDTGIWTDEVLHSRAKHYGMSVEEYKTKNILKTEITSHDVAELITTICGSAFDKTTGAQVPIDGGNDRVI
jgi:rhamnose utilization protein RhaD (predicted bifunctional aldolase and dehydrogenase)/NAD(P)-dependent dehydrogenase (short-subunit alcohol dehydrogenase family)